MKLARRMFTLIAQQRTGKRVASRFDSPSNAMGAHPPSRCVNVGFFVGTGLTLAMSISA